MNQVKCINCGFPCLKYGKTRKGAQRWQCPECKTVFTNTINRTTKHFHQFIQWLLSGKNQDEMSVSSRTFRRNTAQLWEIWPMPPKIEEHKDIVFVDGIYLGRKACVLICCDETHVLGWYVCRYEHTAAWEALLQRIASPIIVVTDGVELALKRSVIEVGERLGFKGIYTMCFAKLSDIQHLNPKH